MSNLSLNITSMVLYVVGTSVIVGSNIWILTTDFQPEYKVAFASSNIASIFSIGVGAILTQVDLHRAKRSRNAASIEHDWHLEAGMSYGRADISRSVGTQQI